MGFLCGLIVAKSFLLNSPRESALLSRCQSDPIHKGHDSNYGQTHLSRIFRKLDKTA